MAYRQSFFAACLALVLPSGTAFAAQDAKPVECVEHLGKTREFVNDYWSFKLFKVGAFDLDGAVERLRADAVAANTPDLCADVIERFMASLRDGHASLAYFPGRTPRRSPPGIRIQRVKARMMQLGDARPRENFYVVADTTRPELDGVEPGWEVLTIDGRPVQDVAADLQARISASTAWGLEHWTDRALLRGAAGTSVALSLRASTGELKEVTLRRPAASETTTTGAASGDAEPETPRWVTWRRLDGGFGYIRITTFSRSDAVDQLDQALDSLRTAKGLVLDVRDNGGGSVGVLQSMVGRFFPRKVLIARTLVREPRSAYVYNNFAPMVAQKRKWTYPGPLVLLINAGCFSACDLFANALDENGRATLIGPTATGGGSASPVGAGVSPGWDGIVVGMSFFVAHRQDGSHIESRGIRPHIVVRPTVEDYRARRDAELERAIRALEAGEAKSLAGT